MFVISAAFRRAAISETSLIVLHLPRADSKPSSRMNDLHSRQVGDQLLAAQVGGPLSALRFPPRAGPAAFPWPSASSTPITARRNERLNSVYANHLVHRASLLRQVHVPGHQYCLAFCEHEEHGVRGMTAQPAQRAGPLVFEVIHDADVDALLRKPRRQAGLPPSENRDRLDQRAATIFTSLLGTTMTFLTSLPASRSLILS